MVVDANAVDGLATRRMALAARSDPAIEVLIIVVMHSIWNDRVMVVEGGVACLFICSLYYLFT